MEIIEYTEGMKIPELGFVANMPNDVYQAIDTHVSNSRMKLMGESPFKYFNPSPWTDTRPKQMGSAIHAAILEPKMFQSEYMLLPEIQDRRKPEYKRAKEVFGESRTFVGNECENIETMFNAVYTNDAALELLTDDGINELSGFAVCHRTGLKLRIRFDRLNNFKVAVDLKKTQSVSDRDLSNTIFNYGYHIQEAFYSYVFELIAGYPLESFKFVFVEEKHPNEVSVRHLDDISKAIAKEKMLELLDNIKHYSENRDQVHNNAPEEMIALPEWVMREYENNLGV